MSNYTPIDDLVEKHKKGTSSESITISKEGEPISLTSESLRQSEVILDEAAPKVENEKNVERYIQDVSDNIELDPQLKKAGLQVVDNSKLSPFHKVQLPIPDEKIIEGLDKPYTSSWRWLSELAVYILSQAHISLKKIHGKVVRVLKK